MNQNKQWLSFFLKGAALFCVIIISNSCGGDGSSKNDDSSKNKEPPLGVVSGSLSVGDGQVLDGDTNDPNNPRIDNNTMGQSVPIPVNIGGYANQSTDSVDIYRVDVQSPITIVLGIAKPKQGDLDLSFEDTSGTPIKQSTGTGSFEIIETDPGDIGEFLIVVRAQSGSSNYVLSLGISPATSSSMLPLVRNSEALLSDADFVDDEIIIYPRYGLDDRQARSMISTMADYFGLVQKSSTPSGPLLMKLDDVEESEFMIQRYNGNKRFAFSYATDEERKRAQTLEIIKVLRNHPAIDYAEPNYIHHITALPTDEFFKFQWHYPLIALPQAWDITKGSDEVVVAVIDTGVVTNHPDLSSRILRDGGGDVIGYDFISDPDRARDGDGIDPDPFDNGDLVRGTRSSFHGTHVAGTVGAATDNDLGVAGITWSGKIMPLRVLGVRGGTSFDLAQAIRYAAGVFNTSGTVPSVTADVINLSLGPRNPFCQSLPPISQTIADAVNAALEAGVVVIAAAGNDNCDVP
ncbi:MAG: S8 family serine peptidase, partial [Desulfatiglandales bacterium]